MSVVMTILSRLWCRIASHRWATFGRLQVCTRVACYGQPDASRCA